MFSTKTHRLQFQFMVGGLLLWIALLSVAFLSYPSLDNLVVSWPVFVIQGVDAVGSLLHEPLKFIILLVAETALVIGAFAALGSLSERLPR